jgi:hypothetical protein
MTRFSRFAFRSLEAAFAAVFLVAIADHVLRADFRPLVALSVPLLVVFYGFASVLFVRGRALAQGPWQTRSLYAAERAMQATVWYLVGILLGVIVYTATKRLGVRFDPAAPQVDALWLLLFLAPYAFMQAALTSFLRGMWALGPDFFRGAGPLTLARRVRQP